MPIASAATWEQSQNNESSRSSICSNETPQLNHVKNEGRRGRRENSGRSQDDFHENQFPSSIKEYPQLESSYSLGEESTEELSPLRQKCGEIVDDERTQMFILILIAVNSIMYGVATFPTIKDDPDIQRIFDIVDLLFLVIFTIESILQIFFNGFTRFFKDGWLVFDLIIVMVSWVSVEIDELSAFRVMRALRFLTRVSVLRNVVVALLSIVPAITAIFTLLLLIFYIFAVMFTALFKDLYAEGSTQANYFGRLDYSLFTLFQIMCMDEWSGIVYEVLAVHYWAWTIFVAFIVMSAFVVVNLLIAVICDALQILRTAEEAMLEEQLYAQEKDEEDEGMGEGGDDGETHPNERMQQKVNEMQQMLDEMIIAQESMARTIQHLSISLYTGRKSDDLLSIREVVSDERSNEEGTDSEEILIVR